MSVSSFSFWKVGDKGQLSLDDKSAGNYVSKQIGLEARKIRATRALASFADPTAAVTNYNTELEKLELSASGQFNTSYNRAVALGYSDDMAKDYATKCTASWLDSEMELLDYEIPYASNTNMMINAKVHAPIMGQSSRGLADSPAAPIQGRARHSTPQKKRARKGKGRK
jgi:hypothetical protein